MVFTTIIPPSTHLYFRKSLPTARPRIRCSSNTSSIATAFDLKTYCSTLREKINQKPEEIVPVQYPQLIYEAMRYSVLAKGAKRAPPVMCISACEFLGGNRLAAFPTACALKMARLRPTPVT